MFARFVILGGLVAMAVFSWMPAWAQDVRPKPAPPAAPDFGTTAPGEVRRIGGGPVHWVECEPDPHRHVHLLGVRWPREAHHAAAARTFLEHLLLGESVYVLEAPDARLDGRIATGALVYRAPDALFVNLELIRQGYAFAHEELEFTHKSVFLEFQEQANASGKGVWSAAKPDPAPAIAEDAGAVEPQPGVDSAEAFFVTRSGKKYHRAGCRFLTNTARPIAKQEARERYEPCSHCKPEE